MSSQSVQKNPIAPQEKYMCYNTPNQYQKSKPSAKNVLLIFQTDVQNQQVSDTASGVQFY